MNKQKGFVWKTNSCMFAIQGLATFLCAVQLKDQKIPRLIGLILPRRPLRRHPRLCPAQFIVQLLLQSCQALCKILPKTGTLARCNTCLVASHFICALMKMHGGRPAKRRTSDMAAFKALQKRQESSPVFNVKKYFGANRNGSDVYSTTCWNLQDFVRSQNKEFHSPGLA